MSTVSRGARLYIPLAWYALQSLYLLHKLKKPLGAWLRIAQSLILFPPKELGALWYMHNTDLYSE